MEEVKGGRTEKTEKEKDCHVYSDINLSTFRKGQWRREHPSTAHRGDQAQKPVSCALSVEQPVDGTLTHVYTTV